MMENILILTWNEEKWPAARMQALMDRFSAGEAVVERWKVGAHRKSGIGDRVFLARVGARPAGIIASGRIDSHTWEDEDFEDPGKSAWYANVRFDYFAPSPLTPTISPYELEARLGVPASALTPQRSGTPYRGEPEALLAWWREITGADEFVSTGEVDDEEAQKYREGALKKVYVNRYERDPKVRDACLRAHGFDCKACGINLARIYGPKLGKGFIHVHHLKPISTIGDAYEPDPVADLVPLCPNCHAMIHRQDPPLSLEEVRAAILPSFRDACA